MLKLGRIPKPITAVRGRDSTFTMLFYDSYNVRTQSGTLSDLSDYSFVCDFKYAPDDEEPIFTLEGPDSPAEITLTSGGSLTLILSKDNTELVEIGEDRELTDFPFRPVVFEVLAIHNITEKEYSIAMGVFNFLEKSTRSDDV